MHRFSVWAPAAITSVDVVLPASGARHSMTPSPDGWWTAEVGEAGHGTDYAFSVDGGPPTPDPRSIWQPNGVHGPSRVFDPGLQEWTDTGWRGRDVLGALFYELHVGTFTPEGTFDAAVRHLDHLVDLGVDVVELMPVAAFDGRHGWGYDGVDLHSVHEPYGGPGGLQRFVDTCHSRGLAVCLDVVFNHLGPSGNYLDRFGPYFTTRHTTPWGPAVNLDDEGSVEVRRWICDAVIRWLTDFHIDALRLDAVHAFVDGSDRHLLAQLSDEVAALSASAGRTYAVLAETDLNDPATVEPTSAGGLGMTAQWSDDFHHALHALLTGERQAYYCDFGTVEVLTRTLTQVFRHAGDHSTFRGLDWGRPVDPARHRGHAFLGYLQNHDQIGNRALGDRNGATLSLGRLAVGAALVLTSPFTPLLFMGEEWAASTPWRYFSDFPDERLGDQVRAGRRAEFARFGWDATDVPDPQDPETREVSVLDWTEPGRGVHALILRWHRDLIRLRRAEPDLRDDDLTRVRVSSGDGWFTVHRGGFDVLVNLGEHPVTIPVPPGAVPVLEWEPVRPADGGLELPPDSVAVVRLPR
ncbi:MAG: malto-oligosyltrehalose trehalohydrolase [Actinomycetales bacterium]|nr:malto-oligosyltrehalose trehalohydrolase [Actinomycetales bacterium]